MKIIAALLSTLGFVLLVGAGILLAQTVPDAGIASEITSVTIGDDGIPVVTFTLADGSGHPLSLDDIESVNFLIARIEENEDTGLPEYINYFTQEIAGAEYQFQGQTKEPALPTVAQPTFEGGNGAFAEIAPGEYTYTFGQALGEDYDPSLTHVVGAVVVRGPRTVAANPTFTFRPNGRDVRLVQELVDTQGCNNCHQDLAAHGGSRKSVQLCVMCHTPQNVDPESGNILDMKVMIHRIHSGANLPSVQAGDPYDIVGFRQAVHDYSAVVWPQDTRNCTTCHTNPEADDFLDSPSPAACTSCHDNVDPTLGVNHPGSPKSPDSCSRCHFSDLVEFDEESILGAHVIPSQSSQVAGVNLAIVGVENAMPGQSPVITLKVTTNAGAPIAPADMDYLAVTLAGPTSDYVDRVTETIFRKPSDNPPPVEDVGDGSFRYTLNYVLPEDSTGTYAFGLEGYKMETLEDVPDPVRIASFNPVTYVSLDGGQPEPRRQVIDLERCDACHKDLALHGTIRQNPEYCVLCHNPNATDEDQRPDDALPPVSINFPLLIHRIHRGSDATQPLQVYGFGGQLHDFSAVVFPGDLAACESCHLSGTYTVDLADRQPTTITQSGEVISQIQPARAVCTTCHDSAAADGHAQLQTTVDAIETCVVCHGPDREFDVAEFHHQLPGQP